ncbi:MAG: InlB B-repeat-containing protein [Lachnospiraceae bacterium]|nr:InlB B-repeat-containing protein [Lachnospiraceae bacterium]
MDRVIIDGARLEDQLWLVPTVEDEDESAVIVYYEASRSNIKVGKKEVYDILLLSHLHTICGNRFADVSAHLDGSIHTDVVNFIQVKNENEIIKNIGLGYKYFVLATDVEITKAIGLRDGSAICLNGHELKIRRGVKMLQLASGETVSFTDCKHDVKNGMITTGVDREAGYSIESVAMNVVDGTLNFYNLRIASINYVDTTKKQEFINVNTYGTVSFNNVEIMNNKIDNRSFLSMTDNTKMYVASASIINNTIDNTVFMDITDGEVTISTMSVVRNIATVADAMIDGFINLNDTTVSVRGVLNSIGNTIYNGSVFVVDDGTLTVNEFNAIGNNAYIGAGILLDNDVNFTVTGKAVYRDNKAVSGSAIMARNNQNFVVTTRSEIVNNEAVFGSAIAATHSRLVIDGEVEIVGNKAIITSPELATLSSIVGLSNASLEFANSNSRIILRDNESEGAIFAGINRVIGTVDLVVSGMTFENNKASNIISVMSSGINNTDFDDLVFTDNSASDNLIKMEYLNDIEIGDGLVFTGMNKASNSIIYLNGGYIRAGELRISGIEVGRAAFVLDIDDELGYNTELRIASVSYIGNTGSFLYARDAVKVDFEDTAIIRDNIVDAYGVIDVASASVSINNETIVKDNKTLAGDDYNVVIREGAKLACGYLYAISTSSEIYFSDINTESEIFEHWNEYDIEGFDTYDDDHPAYLPEEIFKVDEGSYNRGFRVYKKGTYSDVTLMLGKEYEKLVFTSDKDHKDIIATQYVAKNIETYVDAVKAKGIVIEDAIWVAPDLYDETKETDWIFGNGERYSVKITDTRYVTLISHTHKICGLLATESCAHMGGEEHKVVTFKFVSNLDELISALSGPEPAYVALRNDMIIQDNLKTPIKDIASGSTICLAGHNMIFEHGNSGFRFISNGVLNITDCGNAMKTGVANRGYITEANNVRSLNESPFNVQIDAEVNFYNVQIATFSFTNADYGMSIVNVGRDAKVNLHDVHFIGNSINGVDVNFISNSQLNGDILYDKVTFKDNTVGINDSLMHLRNRTSAGGLGITFGELTFDNNNGGIAVEVDENVNTRFDKLVFTNNSTEMLLAALNNTGVELNVVIATGNVINNAIYAGEGTSIRINGESIISSNSVTRALINLSDSANAYIAAETKIEDNRVYGNASYTPVYIGPGSTLEATATISIARNTGAKFGGAITVEESALELNDNFIIKDNEAQYGGAIALNGSTLLSNGATPYVLSGNYTKESPLGVSGQGREVYVYGAKSEITNIRFTDESENINALNKDSSIVYAEADALLENVAMLNNDTNATLISARGNAATISITLHDVSIKDNRVDANGVITLATASLIVGGNMVVKDNKATISSVLRDANIVVDREAISGDQTLKISSSSEIYVQVKDIESPFFRYWNDLMIASFSDVSGMRVMYAPTEIFHIDNESTVNADNRIYKAGAYDKVELRLGKEYEVLRFKERKTSPVVLATQYVAKNTETYVDYVKLHDRPMSQQVWIAPSPENEKITVNWEMDKAKYSVNLTEDAYALLFVHTHTACGHTATDSVAHMDGTIHDELLSFTDVSSLDEILNNHVNKYFVLNNDIVIDRPLDSMATGSVICLNGYQMKLAKGLTVLTLAKDKDLTFTDCRGTAAIVNGNTVVSRTKDSVFDISGNLNMYNITISSMSFTSALGQSVLKADSDARLYLENVTIKNIDNDSTLPVVDIDSTITYVASVSIANVKTNTANVISLKLADNLSISTLSIVNNSVANGSLIKLSGNSYLDGEKIVVRDNAADYLVELDNAKVEFESQDEVNNNAITSIFYTNTKSTISNLIMTGKTYKILDVDTGAELVLLGTTSIINNVLTDYAIDLKGTIYVEGDVQINSNNTVASASILVHPNALIRNVPGKKIATSSKISVEAMSNNTTIFKYWNEYSFEDFKNTSTMNDPSKMFLIDDSAKSLGYKVYKKGSYSNVELVIGNDYVPITFKVNDVVIATQYVARNVLTYVDPVVVDGKDENKQIWLAPSSTDETKQVEWSFTRGNYNVKLTRPNSFILKVHKHRICGLPSTASCAHFDNVTHADVEWSEVTSMQDFIDNYNLPVANRQHYFVLATNCEVNIELDKYLSTGDAICLNGYKLEFLKGYGVTLASGKLENLTITDCGGIENIKGAIAPKAGIDEGSLDYHITARYGELRFYGVQFDGFVIDAADDNTRLMDIRKDAKVVFDGVTFKNNIYDNADNTTTWLKIHNNADVTFYDTTFRDNKVYNSSGDPDVISSVITINGNTNTKYASMSFINNEVPLSVLSVGRDAISVGTMSFIGNTVRGMNGEAGAVLTIDNMRLTIDGESRFEGNHGPAVSLSGSFARLEAHKDMYISGNEAEKGAAFDVEDNAILVLTDKMYVTDNIATYGVIYANGANITTDPTLATFNMINNVGRIGAGIYLDNSTLNITNTLTLLGNDGSTLVVDNTSTSAYAPVISKVTIDGAYGDKDGAAIKILSDNVTLDDIKVKNANAVGSIIAVYGKNTTISKADIRDNRSTNSTLVIDDVDATLNIYDETDITDNTNGATGAVYVKRGTVSVGDRIKINDNRAFTGNARNVFMTSGGSMYADTTHKLSTKSDISVSVENKEIDVLKLWNEDRITGFDSVPVFTPDNILKLDREYAGTNTRLYKSGKYADVSVKLGDDYALVEFKKKETDTAVIATQYVARNVESYLDRVTVEGIPVAAQNWIAPSVLDPTQKVIWNMYKNRCHVKVDGYTVITLGSHEHTLCGNFEPDRVPHIDGSIHDSLVSFTEVNSVDDIINMASVKYFALATDVEIDRPLDTLLDGSAICLNGYKLSIVKGIQLFNLTNKKIYIEDCGLRGYTSVLTHSANQSSTVSPMFNVSGTGELYFYNVKVDGLTTSATNNQKFINAVGGKVVLSSTSVINTTNNSTDGFITVDNAKLVLDKAEFAHNTNSKKFITINTLANNVIVSSTSIIDNNNSGYMMALEGSNEIKLGNVDIENNVSTGDGSIFYVNGPTLTFASDSSVIKNNKGVKGSVIRMTSGGIKAKSNVNMSYNEATDGGVIYMTGGDIQADSTVGSYTFEHNKAVNGGVIYADGITFAADANIVFTNNSAKNGSTIYAKDSTLDMSATNKHMYLYDNIATVGTIYFNNIRGLVRGNRLMTFNGNAAEKGTIYAFANNNTAVTISSLSVSDITVPGSAMYFDGGSQAITFKNSRFEHNGSATSVGSVMYIDGAKVTLDKDVVFNHNYNAVFNNGGTFTTTTLTGPHAAIIDPDTTNDIVFVNGLGDYVLSGNNGATFNLGGGVFKNTANDSTYSYKLSTPAGITGDSKVNFLFNGNITFATGSNMRNIYVTNAATEIFKIGTATRDMKLSYYVPERGTKVIDDINSAGGFTPTFTYKDVVYAEDPYRDTETPGEPWIVYVQKVNGVDNVYIGYKTYEVTIYANGGKFKGMTGDSHRIVPPGVVNPTTYSILIPDGYKILYLTTPSRLGYKTTQFSTKKSATESGAVVVTNDTVYNHSTHGDSIYANWDPITYTIKFDPATTSSTGTMADITGVKFDEEIILPNVEFRIPVATFSNWIDRNAIDYSQEDPETAPRIELTYDNMAKVKNLRCSEDDNVVTLYANWEAGPFKVVFEKNTPVSPGPYINDVKGETATQSRSGKVSMPLTQNGYSLTGYRFIGWSKTPLTASESEAIEHDKSKYYVDKQNVMIDPEGRTEVHLYAMWGRNKYYISLAQNEAKGAIPDPYASRFGILYDQKFSDVPEFAPKTRTNYTFTGKFVDSKITEPYARKTYNGTNYYTVDSVFRSTADKTLFPLWNNNEVMITMELGEGSLPAGKTTNIFVGYLDAPYYSIGSPSAPKEADGTFVKPVPATTARLFRKWTTDAAGNNEINKDTIYNDSSNNKVYAIYMDAYDVNITYRGNGGKGKMEPTIVKAGTKVRLRANQFERNNYSFDYWKGSDKKTYQDKQEVELYEDLILYAEWQKEGGGGGGGGGGAGGGTLPTSQQITAVAIWNLDPVTGKYVARDPEGTLLNGWQYTVNSNDDKTSWHYFNTDGTAKTGWINDGTGTYYLDNYGNMLTGLANIDGAVREFNLNGQLIGDDTGLQVDIIVPAGGNSSNESGVWNYDPIINKWKYMVNGQPARNTFFESFVSGTSCWYAVDANGDMLTGLVKRNGNVYYLQESGAEAGKLMANTTINIGGVVFETDAEGKLVGDLSLFVGLANVYDMDLMNTNAQGETVPILEETPTVEPPMVNFANTELREGFVNAGNGIIYFMVPVVDSSGNTTFEKATGVVQIDGFYYYFGDDGVMRTGLTEIDGKLYYLVEIGDKIGSVFAGYITVAGATYFCDPAQGGVATRIG